MERNVLKFINFEMSNPTTKNFLRQEILPIYSSFYAKVNKFFYI